jgi:hypothetical protein
LKVNHLKDLFRPISVCVNAVLLKWSLQRP